MYRNDLPNITKELILVVRATSMHNVVLPESGNYRPTKFQVLPAILPIKHPIMDRRWHRVYQGRHRFIEARAGIMLVTADLEAMLAEQNRFRPAKLRYMVHGEVLNTRDDGKTPPHDGNPRRVPTQYRVLWRAAEKPVPGEPPPGLSAEQLANWPLRGAAWYRIYWSGGTNTWFFIEIGKPIFTDEEREYGAHLHPVLRRYQGVVRIAYPYDALKFQN